MEYTHRPRLSRETRLLLTTAFLALAALWILARVRFPERAATPNPVPPLLTQLSAGMTFGDLAAEVAQAEARLKQSLLALEVPSRELSATGLTARERVAALRIDENRAIASLPARMEEDLTGLQVLALDRASRLAVIRVPSSTGVPPPPPWTPQRPQQPRYLMASDTTRDGISLRPVFVGSLEPLTSPLWSEPIWAVPAQVDLRPGVFVFTVDAAFAGLVIDHNEGLAIVPGAVLLSAANRLLDRATAPAGHLGIDVQRLTRRVADASGTESGVVVTWVDAKGAATTHLAIGDVIEAVDGETVQSPQHWEARTARLSAGDTIVLRVRRRGAVQEIQLVAAAPLAADPALGLTMRARPGIGVDVVRVDRRSAADRAGLIAGDVVTLIDQIEAPTPAQIRRVFAAAPLGRPVLVGVTRGEAHRIATLEK